MANYRVVRSNELYHHGILGMKWGIRRYQNSDGSLTDEGRARYGYSKKELKKAIKGAKKNYSKGLTGKINNHGMTGENYKNVHKKFERSVNNDAKLQSLDRQLSRAEQNAESMKNIQKIFSDDPGMNYYDYKVMDLNQEFSARKAEIAKTYTRKFQEAMLKDIGYEDIELGIEMLKEYGIDTGRRSRNATFVGEDTVTYRHRR